MPQRHGELRRLLRLLFGRGRVFARLLGGLGSLLLSLHQGLSHLPVARLEGGHARLVAHYAAGVGEKAEGLGARFLLHRAVEGYY